jgi:hypothetical protein
MKSVANKNKYSGVQNTISGYTSKPRSELINELDMFEKHMETNQI